MPYYLSFRTIKSLSDKGYYPLSRSLGRLCPFAFSHIPRYAPFSK